MRCLGGRDAPTTEAGLPAPLPNPFAVAIDTARRTAAAQELQRCGGGEERVSGSKRGPKVNLFLPEMADLDLPPGFGHLPLGGCAVAFSRPRPTMAGPLPILKGRGLKRPRPKKVTWAAGLKLCKVRLFLAEDVPSLAGVEPQDRLKAKVSKFMHAPAPVSKGGASSALRHGGGKQMPRRLVDDATIQAVVPLVAWRKPTVFGLDASWSVKAGEESVELKVQQTRQVRFLEAVYPRSSSIPSSPAEPQEAPLNAVQDDVIPLIPLLPVEEDTTEPAKSGFPLVTGVALGGQGPSVEHGSGDWVRPQADPANLAFPPISAPPSVTPLPFQQQETKPAVSTAASVDSVVAQAVKKSREAGSLVDSELLLKILKNPSLLNILNNPSLMQSLVGKNCTPPAANLSEPPTASSSFVPHSVGGAQASRAEFCHSAPAFVQHPSFSPFAYPAQVQDWQSSTRWR